MRWLKRIAVALAVVLALFCLALAWLLETGSGLRFALARAQGFTDGALSVQQADGRLAGPIRLHGLRYHTADGLDARVAELKLEVALWPLLRKQLRVQALHADGVDVNLPPADTAPQEQGNGLSLNPPIAIVVEQAHVGRARIHRGASTSFASDSLDLAGRWTDQWLVVRQLALRAPDGHVDLHGQLVLGTHRQGDGQADFAWSVNGVTYAGQLQAHSDGDTTHASATLTRPMRAELRLQLDQHGSQAWTATLKAPKFDPAPWLGPDNALKSVAIDLGGRGDRRSGTLDGTVSLNGTTLKLAPLQARLSDDLATLQLQRLQVTSPQIKGALAATGTLQLDAQPVSARLQLQWHDVVLPAELAGQPLASAGTIAFDGSAARYHAAGKLKLGPPGQWADLQLDLDGTRQQIDLHTLTLKQPHGRFSAGGTLTLQPQTRWQLKLDADHFDPGALVAGWNGALDAHLASQGTLAAKGPDATLEIATLRGQLRGKPVHGQGTLHLSPNQVVDGSLELTSDGNTVRVQGQPGPRNDVQVQLALDALQQWLPEGAGSLHGTVHLQGRWRALGVDANLHGRGLAWHQQRVDALQLEAHIPDITVPSGALTVQTQGVHASGLTFSHIDLRADGTRADHHLRLDAEGEQLDARLLLDGRLEGKRWSGTLATLDLQPQGLPRWSLLQSAQLGYQAGRIRLDGFCLSAGAPRLCLDGSREADGAVAARYSVQAMPIAMLLDASGYAQLPLRADGILQGNGTLGVGADGALTIDGDLQSPRGSISYTQQAERPLLAWHDLALKGDVGAGRQHISLVADLQGGGRIDGRADISGPHQALDGEVSLRLNDLAPLELLSAELANVSGTLDAHFQLGGTLSTPALDGQASVDRFAAEVPRLGLKLTDGNLVARTQNARQFALQGTVKSGKGTLRVGGQVGLGSEAPTRVTLDGEQVTVADIPAAKVVTSPALAIEQNARGTEVSGALAIDSAEVDLDRLRGITGDNVQVVKASPDVVVVDEKKQEQSASQLPLTVRIKVDLGKHTHVIGMGLDGKLKGTLAVIEQPGKVPLGQGQITVDGTYKAYGQDLLIQDGRLLFASTPLDDPGLNIRAVRKLNPNATIDEGQEVGLLITGTAQHPNLTVFSNPVMEQSDALSYLITGKPLSQVNSGEGNTVNAAAQALGSAAGNLLAKRIGSRLGVDEIGVSSSDALGGTSAFTVGKYLSPRLYISYGVGLFEPGQVITLRYRLSQRWSLEAQNATSFNRASLNYRIER